VPFQIAQKVKKEFNCVINSFSDAKRILLKNSEKNFFASKKELRIYN